MSSIADGLSADSGLSVAAEGLALTFGVSLDFDFDFDNDTNNSVDDDHNGQ
ncbi:hypothetical protein GCM10016272_21910 [Psychrobacter glaciei]|uniref:Uncharacterized protein n=1 Tax=Psychrobacter glaciei TaxID=619771 RepID=A0ABQ3GU13_9GAMM|nr:hypothetical protein GCM10016272_21910 [Psychrobacter glaciei]